VGDERRAAAGCAVAFLLRIGLPLIYLAVVGLLPVRLFELGPGATAGWLVLTVLVLPAVVVIALVALARRGRDRRR
jgi:ABC-type phosphate transport system permease subunit